MVDELLQYQGREDGKMEDVAAAAVVGRNKMYLLFIIVHMYVPGDKGLLTRTTIVVGLLLYNRRRSFHFVTSRHVTKRRSSPRRRDRSHARR